MAQRCNRDLPTPKPPRDPGLPREQKGAADTETPEFHFNPITPEDWRANEAPLADLYQRGIVSAEYVRQRLNIPEEAGSGTMAPQQQQPPKPLGDVPTGLPGGRSESKRPEKWRLKQTRKGVIAERLE
jgi:hypothetical protein